jgi:predicted AAA+ superfamily ATPase
VERKIINSLIQWKNNPSRKPLVLHGGRQSGKTFALMQFGKQYYKNVAYFNFDNSTRLKTIFDKVTDTNKIIADLSAISGQKILKHDTLIILDEMQAFGHVVNSLKFFMQNNNDYHIIAVMSVNNIKSIVLKETLQSLEHLTMHPLDFEEYLLFLGENKSIEQIRHCFDTFEPMNEFEHNRLMNIYNSYLITGGMPSVVKEYYSNGDQHFSIIEQKKITDLYIADMLRYAPATENAKIFSAFSSIPLQLEKENRKFMYSIIKKGGRANEFDKAISWLLDCGSVIKCPKICEGKHANLTFSDLSSFKLYLSDTGLLFSKFDIPIYSLYLSNDIQNIYKSALTESYVAGALHKNGHMLHYWVSAYEAEIDFVINDKQGNIVPIEIEYTKNEATKSMKEFKKKYAPPYVINITAGNFEINKYARYVPLYAVHCI